MKGKMITTILIVCALTVGFTANAQTDVDNQSDASRNAMGESTDESTDIVSTRSDAAARDVAEDIRAASPRLQDPDRRGFFQVGLGPAVSFGLESDNAMYNFFASYNRSYGDNLIGKVMGDAYLATGGDTSRFLNLSVGADYLFSSVNVASMIPYAGGQIGYGGARSDETDDLESSFTLGAGAGLKFMAADLNWDVNLQYSILTAEIDGSSPSLIGLRAGVNF